MGDAVSKSAYRFNEDLVSVSQNSRSPTEKSVLRKSKCNAVLHATHSVTLSSAQSQA